MPSFPGFNKFVDLQIKRATLMLTVDLSLPESHEHPCKLCDGSGILITRSTISTINTPSKNILDVDGNDVQFRAAIRCPECSGNGIDIFEFTKTVDAHTASEVA